MSQDLKPTKSNSQQQPQQDQLTSEVDLKETTQTKILKNSNNQTTEEQTKSTLDPTHFGDWQINCRAIDF